MIRNLLTISALFALAACNSGTGNTTAPAAPVAEAKPPAGQSWTDIISETPDGGFVQGNPAAPVKLIEYGSRACPVCQRFATEGVPALRAGPIAQGKLSYEFRDYPVHGALDLAPIALGLCGDVSTRFAILDQMFENQQALLTNVQTTGTELQAMQARNPQLGPVEISKFFAERLGYAEFMKQRGLPQDKANACLSDPKAYDLIQSRFSSANSKYNISGTPTFIVNGQVVPDASSWDALKPALRAAGAL